VPSGEDGGRAAIKTPPRAQAQRVRHVETPLWSSVGRPRHRVARPRLSRAGPPPNVRFAIWLSDRTSHTSVRNDDERHVFRSLAWGPPAKRSHVAVCTTLGDRYQWSEILASAPAGRSRTVRSAILQKMTSTRSAPRTGRPDGES